MAREIQLTDSYDKRKTADRKLQEKDSWQKALTRDRQLTESTDKRKTADRKLQQEKDS